MELHIAGQVSANEVNHVNGTHWNLHWGYGIAGETVRNYASDWGTKKAPNLHGFGAC